MENSKIEKPWGVYGFCLGPWGIGKVLKESENSCNIQYSEQQLCPVECWDSLYVKRFENPLEAINYFFKHNKNEKSPTKEKIIESFLNNFPSEKKNLNSLIAQT